MSSCHNVWIHWPPDIGCCRGRTSGNPLGSSRSRGCWEFGGLKGGGGSLPHTHWQPEHRENTSADVVITVSNQKTVVRSQTEPPPLLRLFWYLSGCDTDLLCSFFSSILKQNMSFRLSHTPDADVRKHRQGSADLPLEHTAQQVCVLVRVLVPERSSGRGAGGTLAL